MLAAVLLLALAQSPAACADVPDCRAQALAARAAGDYERFHDFAWRVVQKGKPNDPRAMYLLARAQSLSGRPDDALVMLGRLADQGVIADAETNPDFARVRALPRWSELEARLRAMGPPNVGPSLDDSRPATPDATVPGRAREAPAEPFVRSSPPAAAAAPPAPARKVKAHAFVGAGKSGGPDSTPAADATASRPASDAGPPTPPAAAAPSVSAAAPAAPPDFDSTAISPIGLAHDDVSRRFVMADANSPRLVIIDELSHHVVTLVSADAGFLDRITGFTIDALRGDLWVTSTRGDAGAAASRLHKLQLVSGRVLQQIDAPTLVKLVDVAVDPDGTVYALDGADSRLLRLPRGATSMEVVMSIPGGLPTAIAAGEHHILYVATTAGIVAIDAGTRSTSAVRSSHPLSGIQALAYRGGALVAVQRRDSGSALILLPLDASGLRVTRLRVLGAAVDQSPVAVAGDKAYYLSSPGVIGHVSLK
ncbi:MAG: hypothetical protein ACRD1V_21685 [Vicinamibacterales bacterium]